MSRDGSIVFEWGDSERRFRLPIGQLRDVQEHKHIDAGPEWIYNRLDLGGWRVDDIVETIRLGLIGGGLSRSEANSLVAKYVTDCPLMDNREPAMLILAAALVGAPDEAPKKAQGEMETDPNPSPVESGVSQSSTETAL